VKFYKVVKGAIHASDGYAEVGGVCKLSGDDFAVLSSDPTIELKEISEDEYRSRKALKPAQGDTPASAAESTAALSEPPKRKQND